MESLDRRESELADDKSQRLAEKIEILKGEIQKLKKHEAALLAAPDQQISLTDPDARSMATSGRGTGMVGYNVQTAVDTKHHLIVAHEVTNVGHDRQQLTSMGQKATEALGVDEIKAVVDRGYFNNEEIKSCEEAGITTFLPKPRTSNKRTTGYLSKDDFIYHAEENYYQCPAGQRLVKHTETMQGTQKLYKYWTTFAAAAR
jgi:hypothetical protein